MKHQIADTEIKFDINPINFDKNEKVTFYSTGIIWKEKQLTKKATHSQIGKEKY